MISCVVCHHKGDLIYKAVESLKKSKRVEVEIIVMSSVWALQIPGARVIHSTENPCKKRNYGTIFAHGEYIAFFDDDVEVSEDAVYEMKKALESERVGMVFGKTKNMEFRERFDEAGSFLTYSGFLWARAESGIKDVGQFEKPEPILAGKSASCMIKRSVFNKIGGFDSDFGILGEETDLAWRVWLYGYMVMWCPQSVTYHAFNTKFKPQDFYTNERVYYNGCRNYITMLFKNLETNNLWILLLHIPVWIGASLGMLLTGKFRSGWNILRGLAYVLDHLSTIHRKRRDIQKRRVLKDQELFSFVLRQPKITYYLERFLRYIRLGLHG